uniref:Uncharacterized protein n=1 Tax=viral metagenome TaxID=1070528 RepID=A0A6C0B0L2_9ZZZZ
MMVIISDVIVSKIIRFIKKRWLGRRKGVPAEQAKGYQLKNKMM